MKLLAELKRRNLFKVAAVYAGAVAIVVPIADIVVTRLHLPDWSTPLVILLLVIGFPIALLIAWFFEMTPDGMKWRKDVTAGEHIPRGSRAKFAALIISMAFAAGGLLLFQFVGKHTDPADKSIAVFPFEDRGGRADSPYFAAGIQDDLLNNLAKIEDLKVISRASVMSYSEKSARTLSEIGQELGVSYILKGSVHCPEDRVKINIRLFHTASDKPIWEKDYDRTLPGSLTLQGELALEITARLRIPISPAVKARLMKNPTDSPTAWVWYHKGREAQLLPENSKEHYSTAGDFYKEAIRHDSGFVLARARLSFMQALLYQSFQPTDIGLLADARKNADKALSHDPDSGEAHLASARCAQLERNEALTKSELSDAVRLLPNDASTRLAAAITQQQQGWKEDAVKNFKRASELGPREARIFVNYGYLLYETGQEVESRNALNHALLLEPESIYFRLVRAYAEISWSGDTGRAREILAGLPAGQDPDGRVTSAYCTLAILERKFPEALRLLEAYPKEKKTLSTVESGGLGEQQLKVEAEAAIHFYAGDYVRACEYFESIRPDYEDAVRNKPQSVSDHAALAVLYAWMSHCPVDKNSNGTGWKELAKAEAARVIELNASAAVPIERAYILALAKIYAWVSEPDLAWQQIEQFLALPPSGYSVHNFRLDPVWDPLRNDPRFQKLTKTK
jgi:TolB-like protein